MTEGDLENLERAQTARQKLANQFLDHPEVSLIDIGYDSESRDRKEQIVLRVHLRQTAAQEKLQIPAEIDGIPVRVLHADFRLE
ncbi:MAG: hypothetical protein ACK2T5_08380 [Anaerolineales bacterium]|jgi:hypothetical protein